MNGLPPLMVWFVQTCLQFLDTVIWPAVAVFAIYSVTQVLHRFLDKRSSEK